MDLSVDEIKKLMQDFKETGLGSFELTKADFNIKFTSETAAAVAMQNMQKSCIPVVQEKQVINQENTQQKQEEKQEQVEEKGTIVKSPIVGTVFTSQSPGNPPYVNVGDRIKKGDIIFIIESMKLMNEIVSEFDGEVAEILVKNGQSVEYGQPILRLIQGE